MRTIAVIACCVAVAGCASLPKGWTRPDGAPITPAQLQLDDTICRGETEKAATQGRSRSTINDPFPSDQARGIYEGCMAQRGYLAAK
jgi:hypothetical protein